MWHVYRLCHGGEDMKGKDIIKPEECGTLYGLFRERARRTPDHCAYRDFDRKEKRWVDMSWAEFAREVARWQSALASEGLVPGDRVALSLRNSREWAIFEQAAIGLGLVVVSLYTDDRPDNAAYILQDAGVSLLLVQDAGHWRRLAPALARFDHLKVVLFGEPDPHLTDPRVRWTSQWLPDEPGELVDVSGDSEDLATIAYTSGTGGNPKGVMLSHRNILSVAYAGLELVSVYPSDVFLSFLPLSHMFERTAGYYLPMMAGATIAHSRSVAQLGEDLATIRPTAMFAVPRIFERLHGRMEHTLEKSSPLKRWLFEKTVSVGWSRFERTQGRAGWSPSQLLWPLLKALVARPILRKLGGKLRLVVTGGAPIGESIARTFLGLGLPILQGYGLTETGPQVSVNPPTKNDPRSVGVVLPGSQVRLGEDDELEVRGPGVMMGYWNNPEATAKVIDEDGWLRTGDRAAIENEHIYIIGRLKDILVLSNGEKVPPADMEMAIASDPLFEQVLIFGEGRPFLAAIVVLNEEVWPRFAHSLGLSPDPDNLSKKVVNRAVLQRISERLRRFPTYAKIRRVYITLEPWSVDNGLLTPTLKVKRHLVLGQYEEEIEAMYELDAA